MIWWIVTTVLIAAAIGAIYLWWHMMNFIFDALFEGPYA